MLVKKCWLGLGIVKILMMIMTKRLLVHNAIMIWGPKTNIIYHDDVLVLLLVSHLPDLLQLCLVLWVSEGKKASGCLWLFSRVCFLYFSENVFFISFSENFLVQNGIEVEKFQIVILDGFTPIDQKGWMQVLKPKCISSKWIVDMG